MKYEIKCKPFPVVVCNLEANEKMITEKGAMCWMSPNMKMETVGGSIGKAIGRMFSGESLFQNIYTSIGGEGLISFASSFPGTIIPFEISSQNELIVQKTAFLASEVGVELSIFFQKRLGAGFFGGEGFIMQKLSGNGTAFVEFDGDLVTYDLEPGQSMIIDTGYLAAMTSTCTMEIQSVPGLKNKFLGGEGLFNTRVTGPGRIYIQTMPINSVANSLSPYIAKGSN